MTIVASYDPTKVAALLYLTRTWQCYLPRAFSWIPELSILIEALGLFLSLRLIRSITRCCCQHEWLSRYNLRSLNPRGTSHVHSMIHHDSKISQIEFIGAEGLNTTVCTPSFFLLGHGFALRGCIAFAFFSLSLSLECVCMCVLSRVTPLCGFIVFWYCIIHMLTLFCACFCLFFTSQFTRIAMERTKVGHG